jgi:hypothetical protein
MGQDNPLQEGDSEQATWMFERGKIFSEDEVGQPKVMGVQGIDLSVESPFVTIWTRPRATIRGIVDTNPRLHVIPIAVVAGIIQDLDRASIRNAGDRLPLSTILTQAIGLGPIRGLVGLYVGAWLLALTGRWLNGRATAERIRAAVAWSFVPTLATIPIWIIQLGVLGREMFTTETPTLDANPALALRFTMIGVAEIVLAIWSIVIFLKCVGEVQGFSAWRALGSVLLVLVPVILVVVIVLVLSVR